MLLDGAGYNAPDFGDEDEKPGSNRPPKPDRKTHPVDCLRWELTYAVPDFMKKSPNEVEQACQALADGITSGAYTWNDEEHQWLEVN